MKKILKKMKKINVKGFTLVEMLGVIVIIGLILIVVFPTMSKMIHDNDNQEYNNYYGLVEEAAQVYAGKLTDSLGTSKYTGCAKIELSTLIDEGYVQAFNDSSTTCTTGANGIVIRNDMGSITVKFQLNCVKDGETKYSNGENDSGSCEAYTVAEENNIKMVLDADSTLGKSQDSGSNIVYITSGKNYIWYSGKLWQIVSYNASTEVVKAVTVDAITSIYYSSSGSSTFSGSDVETWLNNDFLNSLKDSQNFLVSYNWNATANSSTSSNLEVSSKLKKLKVGLITTYEYGKIKSWYGSTGSWLLSENSVSNYNNISTSNGTNVTSDTTTSIHSVRPAVVFSSNVLVYSGTGTESDPYIIDNSSDATASANDYLNTRYSGEYVKLDGKIYRIVSTDGDTTKIISMFSAGSKTFDDDHYDYVSSDLYNSLMSTYYTSATKNYITTGDYCLDTINTSELAYQSSKCLTASRVNNTILVGLPKFADLFTSNISAITSSYWTLNPNTETDADGQAYSSTINVITSTGAGDVSTISSSNETRIVLYMNSSVMISGGKGTSTDPYTLKI